MKRRFFNGRPSLFCIVACSIWWMGCGGLAGKSDSLPPQVVWSEVDPELPAPPQPRGWLELVPIGGQSHGGMSAAEISAYDVGSKRLFTVNGNVGAIDIQDISNPQAPILVKTVSLKHLGGPTSVAAAHGMIAAAVAASKKSEKGHVVFLDSTGKILNTVQVGYEPDMVTFTPDGKRLLVANEGEPVQDYSFDPPGSISLIDVAEGPDGITAANVMELGFEQFNSQRKSLDSSIRIFGKNATVSQDLEPEYIAVSADSKTAWVVCQENNAIAVVDLEAKKVTKLIGLGFKDHSLDGNWLDVSDEDEKIRIRPWPVKGMYQPDGIAAFEVDGKTWLVTANEGDQREYTGFSEKVRVKDLKLNPAVFPQANELQKKRNLGRLQVTSALGDSDGDGQFEEIYSYGGRSFSIWSADVEQVYDSGDQFERFLAAQHPDHFHSDHESLNFDDRSDNKGCEPEGVTIGVVDGRPYVFIVLERIGGVMVYDVSSPQAPIFETYVNTRNFADGTGDSGPEGVLFLAPEKSPTGRPLLIISYEISGTTRFFDIQSRHDVTALSGNSEK